MSRRHVVEFKRQRPIDDLEDDSDSSSSVPSDEDDEGEEPPQKRPRIESEEMKQDLSALAADMQPRRPPQRPAERALQRLESLPVKPELAYNVVRNMFRLSRVACSAAARATGQSNPLAPLDGDVSADGLEFGKDSTTPILEYLFESLGDMLEMAKVNQTLRGRQRLSAEDVRIAVEHTSRFQPFSVSEMLASAGESAPAQVALLNSVRVGKGARKMSRIAYEHFLSDPDALLRYQHSQQMRDCEEEEEADEEAGEPKDETR